MGSGGVEDRRSVTPNANLSDKEIATEDARRQSKNARACADLIRFHSQGRKSHAGRPRNLDRAPEPLPVKARRNG
ncbi:MAG: hypothetical protein WA624_18040 [Methylocella sp.]